MKNSRMTNRNINLYKYQIGNTIHVTDYLPEGIKDYEIIDFDDTPIVEVTDPITKMKLKMQLVISGISLESIEAAIDLIPNELQKKLIRIKWNDANYFERNDVELNMMADMLGISQAELDQIFIDGNLIV